MPVKKLSFPDREQDTGKLIGDFLQRKIKLDPLAVHLLFAANRQNVRYPQALLLDVLPLV